ncbi:MAG TPA: hypothetical protein ENN84_08475 [Candidatus Marinimicrobia bacterium]|nr:hypothetical protein [Candidatus Neomarinimicrobiota bacterium]
MNNRLIKGIIVFLIIFNTSFGRDLQPDNTVFYNMKGFLVSILTPSELNKGIGDSYGKWSNIQYPEKGLIGYNNGGVLSIYSSYLPQGDNRLSWKSLQIGPDDKVSFVNPNIDITALPEKSAAEMLQTISGDKLPGLLKLMEKKDSRWLWQQGNWQNVYLEDGQFILLKPWQNAVTHKKLAFLHSSRPQHAEWIHAGELMWNESNRLVFGNIETLALKELLFPEFQSYSFLQRNPQDRGLIAAIASDSKKMILLLIERSGETYEKLAELDGEFLTGEWNPGGQAFHWLEQQGNTVKLRSVNIASAQINEIALPAAEFVPTLSCSPDGLTIFLVKKGFSLVRLNLSSGQFNEIPLTFRKSAIENLSKIAFSATKLIELGEKFYLYFHLSIDGQSAVYEYEISTDLLEYDTLQTEKLPKVSNHNHLLFYEDIAPMADTYAKFAIELKRAEERFNYYFDFQEELIRLPDKAFNPDKIRYFAYNCANLQLRGLLDQYKKIGGESMKKMQSAMQAMVSESQRINAKINAMQRKMMSNPQAFNTADFDIWKGILDDFEKALDKEKENYKNRVEALNESIASLQTLNSQFAAFLEKEHPPLLEKAQSLRRDLNDLKQKTAQLSYQKADEELLKLFNRELKWFFRQTENAGDLLLLQMIQLGDIETCEYQDYYSMLIEQEKACRQAILLSGDLLENYAEMANIFKSEDKKGHRRTLLAHLHSIRPALDFVERNQGHLAALDEALKYYPPNSELWFWQYNRIFEAWKKYLENK